MQSKTLFDIILVSSERISSVANMGRRNNTLPLNTHSQGMYKDSAANVYGHLSWFTMLIGLVVCNLCSIKTIYRVIHSSFCITGQGSLVSLVHLASCKGRFQLESSLNRIYTVYSI